MWVIVVLFIFLSSHWLIMTHLWMISLSISTVIFHVSLILTVMFVRGACLRCILIRRLFCAWFVILTIFLRLILVASMWVIMMIRVMFFVVTSTVFITCMFNSVIAMLMMWLIINLTWLFIITIIHAVIDNNWLINVFSSDIL